MPTDQDITIVGAGPHGLAVVLHLLAADPTARGRMTVIDPSGTWMREWNEAFDRLDIAHLRSPVVHHPSPDPDSLASFTATGGHPRSGLAYGLPMQSTFRAFCDHLREVHSLDDLVRSARLVHVAPTSGGVRLRTDRGTFTTGRLVLATNPHRRVIPPWVFPMLPVPPARLEHADAVDLRGLDLRDETVAIVGGGLTAAHLVLGAWRRGAKVRWVTRRPVVARMFDVDPGWLGPKRLDGYAAIGSPERRLAAAREARNGGSIPPWMLDALARTPDWTAHAASVVEAVHDADGFGLHLADGTAVRADRLWLATGTTPSLDACTPLRDVLPDIPQVDGFPVPDTDLRIGAYPIHVTGRLATIALGPAAGNLWGAQRGAETITRACTGTDLTAEGALEVNRFG